MWCVLGVVCKHLDGKNDYDDDDGGDGGSGDDGGGGQE